MCNCQRNEKNIQLIRFEHLQFPSASAIEYNQGKIFVLGDDAPYLLALDTAYKHWTRFIILMTPATV